MALPELSQAAQDQVALVNAKADDIELAADLRTRKELGHHISGAVARRSFDDLFYSVDLLPPVLSKPLEGIGEEYVRAVTLRFDALAAEYFRIIEKGSEFEAALDQISVKGRNIPPVHNALELRRAHWVIRSRERATTSSAQQGASSQLEAQTPNQVLGEAVQPDRRSGRWEDIEILFTSDERVQIRDGVRTETLNYGELGLEDRRNGKPNRAWIVFRGLAESGGTIRDTARTGGDWSKVEKRIQEIRRALRKHFGITADPLPFIGGTGYQARLRVGCAPSFRT